MWRVPDRALDAHCFALVARPSRRGDGPGTQETGRRLAPGFVTHKSSPTAPQARVDLVEANERQRRPVIVAHVGRRGVLQERLYDLLVALAIDY